MEATGPVVPQNVVRREMRAATIAKVTKRTELGPLRALPTARHARVERAFRLSPLQCAHLTLMPDIVWDRDFGSGCASCVAMMQPADHREGDDLPPIGGLVLAEFGGVLVEREVGPGPVIVLEVLPQDAPEVLLRENDDVVEAVPPKGTDHALAVGILPRGTRRGEDLLDSHRTHSTNEVCAVDLVSVPEDVLRNRVVGEGVDQLLACPLRGRTISDVEVHDASALMLEYEEHV